MRLMPEAFLYDYDGVEGNLVRLKFRRNTNYNPGTKPGVAQVTSLGTFLSTLCHELCHDAGNAAEAIILGGSAQRYVVPVSRNPALR